MYKFATIIFACGFLSQTVNIKQQAPIGWTGGHGRCEVQIILVTMIQIDGQCHMHVSGRGSATIQ